MFVCQTNLKNSEMRQTCPFSITHQRPCCEVNTWGFHHHPRPLTTRLHCHSIGTTRQRFRQRCGEIHQQHAGTQQQDLSRGRGFTPPADPSKNWECWALMECWLMDGKTSTSWLEALRHEWIIAVMGNSKPYVVCFIKNKKTHKKQPSHWHGIQKATSFFRPSPNFFSAQQLIPGYDSHNSKYNLQYWPQLSNVDPDIPWVILIGSGSGILTMAYYNPYATG